MIDATRGKKGSPPSEWRQGRFRLSALLGLVLSAALGFLGFKWYHESHAVWEQFGGMSGWSQAAVESRLGSPGQIFEGDLPDEHEHKLRTHPTGAYRTCTYKNLDGSFIVWYRQNKQGEFDQFGSKWVEKRRYY